jgi:hypothetical protein
MLGLFIALRYQVAKPNPKGCFGIQLFELLTNQVTAKVSSGEHAQTLSLAWGQNTKLVKIAE